LQSRIADDARLALRTFEQQGADSAQAREQVERLAAHIGEHRAVLRTYGV
jgi:hypothetical protein